MKASVVHQYHPHAAAGDAITNQMIFLQRALGEIGIAGKIFAGQIKGLAANEVHAPDFDEMGTADLLLLHHSQANPSLKEILGLTVPKALVYHNITPSSFFRHDPFIAEGCRLGRKQLLPIRKACRASFADSQYNAFELKTLGYSGTAILPLFDLSASAKPGVKNRRRRLVSVGRLTPHKNQALLVKSLYYLNRFSTEPWELVLVGGKDPLYGEYLRTLAAGLGVSRYIQFTGKASEAELQNHYRESSAFVCTSLHEGFCIPVVEAMRADLPVFSFTQCALKETLGDSGLHLLTQNPSKIAMIWKSVLESDDALAAIRKGQSKRLKQLAAVQSKGTAQKLISRLLKTPPLRTSRVRSASRGQATPSPRPSNDETQL